VNDSILVKKCVNGDQRAQRALFEKFAPRMLGVCLRYAKEKSQAEDSLQEGFIKVFTKIKKYKGGSLEGWIRKIMINTSLDNIRKTHKFKNNVNIDEVDYKCIENNTIIEGLAAADLLMIINTMPVGYRTVFNMFAIEGYSHKEIGKELNVSENTSKSQYSRARMFLKNKLEAKKIER